MYLKDALVRTAKNILVRFPKRVTRTFQFLGEFRRFKKMNRDRSKVKWKDIYPCINDRIQSTPFDHHYIYHPAWAARILAQTRPAEHIDISSILSFSTIVSAFVPVRFYDYRPAALQLSNLESGFADLQQLPFETESIASLSCMHTVEHIGLGRYGDKLDAKGDITAINELKRVLANGGDLLFVTPVGQPRIEFNAHRIYAFEEIVGYFAPLQLLEFSMVPDTGGFINNADPGLVAAQRYACGCFWFRKHIDNNSSTAK